MQEVNIDKLSVVWTREKYYINADSQEDAIKEAEKLEQTGDASDVEVIWDSMEFIEPNEIVQNKISKSTRQVFVEGVLLQNNDTTIIDFKNFRINAEVENVTDIHAYVPNFIAIDIDQELFNKVKTMRAFSKEQDVYVSIPLSAEYFETKEDAQAGDQYEEFTEGYSALTIMPTGGIYFEAHSKYDWGTQVESADLSSYF